MRSYRPDIELIVPATPRSQRRLFTIFRVLLALPHTIVLAGFSVLALVVLVAGWLSALAIGRLPAPIARVLTAHLRYHARVAAFVVLLEETFPPFPWGHNAYPVDVRVVPGRLSRLKVLLRLLIYIPASIAMGIIETGFQVLWLPFWLIAVVLGRLPRWAHETTAAALRYRIRAYGYFMLLGDTLPKTLTEPLASLAVPGPAGPADAAQPGTAPAPVDEPAADAATTDQGTAESASARLEWTPFSKGGRRVTRLLAALGAATYIAIIVVSAVTEDDRPRTVAVKAVPGEDELIERFSAFVRGTQDCADEPDDDAIRACLQTLEADLARSVDAFSAGLGEISGADDERDRLIAAAGAFSAMLRKAADAGTTEDHDAIFKAAQELIAEFDAALAELGLKL